MFQVWVKHFDLRDFSTTFTLDKKFFKISEKGSLFHLDFVVHSYGSRRALRHGRIN